MKTLTITDLARSERLDRPTMAAVRGGWKTGAAARWAGKPGATGSGDASVTVTQDLLQVQDGSGDGSNVAPRGENRIVRR